MRYWELLGIPPSNNAREIKRAYAKKLKTTRPDEKPKEFQALHQAYKTALRQAQRRNKETHSPIVDMPVIDAPIQDEKQDQTLAEAFDTESLSEDIPYEEYSLPDSEQPTVLETPPVTDQSVQDEHVEQVSSLRVPVTEDLSEDSQEQENDLPDTDIERTIVIETPPVTEDFPEDNQEQENDLPDTQQVVCSHNEEVESVQAKDRRLRQEAATHILEKVDEILQESKQLSLESTWHFLIDCPYLLEENFNWELGLAIMHRIAVFNKGERKRSRRGYLYRVTVPALSYLDTLFNWQGHKDFIVQQMDVDLCQPIFRSLEVVKPVEIKGQGVRGGEIIEQTGRQAAIRQAKQVYFGSLLVRALALALDYLGIVILVYLIVVIGYAPFTDIDDVTAMTVAMISGVVGYLAMAFFMEASSFQATPFKMLFGLCVTNRGFGKISYLHNFFRIVCFLITVPFQKIAWFVNCFLGGKLIHDRMSRTYVIDTRKSI